MRNSFYRARANGQALKALERASFRLENEGALDFGIEDDWELENRSFAIETLKQVTGDLRTLRSSSGLGY